MGKRVIGDGGEYRGRLAVRQTQLSRRALMPLVAASCGTAR